MIRVGIGFDAHAFAADRPLVLGGVRIRETRGLAAHSDGDAVAHSLADALLGATGLGDIGEMFPPTEEWRDASSLEILERVRTRLTEAGWSVVNVDATVIAQSVRIAPHRGDMRRRIGDALGIDEGAVSIKGTTTDRLGFSGRDEGVAAVAVVLVQQSRSTDEE